MKAPSLAMTVLNSTWLSLEQQYVMAFGNRLEDLNTAWKMLKKDSTAADLRSFL